MIKHDVFAAVYKPDVLSCLADLSNDEVMTPPDVANQMLDMLPQELFRDPNTKFLDPACKSGVFLREIAKRLIAGLADKIPNLQERCDHIFKEQLYGIAITELTSLLARRSVYCSKYADSPFSITKFENVDGNIVYHKMRHTWDRKGENGHCIYCGTPYNGVLGDANRKGLETHAYEFIHTVKPEEILKMKFDVVISNPPYMLKDGGQKASAMPIYQKFIEQARKLNPRFITMIIPARWYTGGRSLDKFRDDMLHDKHLCKLVDYSDSEECFPGVDVAGGVCYFLWDKSYNGKCTVISHRNGRTTEAMRDLDEYPVFIRYNEARSVIQKVVSKTKDFYSSRVSAQKPFGLRTYIKPTTNGDIKLRYNGGTGPFNRTDVKDKTEWIDKWKVISSYLTYDHAGREDSDGKRRIFSTMEILPPGTICTETYIVIDVFDTEQEAQNLLGYLKTIFVRFLVSQFTSTQHLSRNSFSLVPVQDFSRPWNDQNLYEKYGLTKDETDFIESMIRPMD